MPRLLLASAFLALTLTACDTVADAPMRVPPSAPPETPTAGEFVAGEVIVVLAEGVAFDDLRAYVDADPDLTWKEIVAETAGRIVLLGVPEGEERATAASTRCSWR